MLDELEGDAAEPVPVGDHKLCDVSADRAVQNGEQTPSVEVDAGRDILNDLVRWVSGLEVGALPLEVGALLDA